MQKIIVTESALRELVREALDNKELGAVSIPHIRPVNVSDVVDPSAAVTDPGNENFRPSNPVEFQVAVKALSDDLPTEKIPDIYEKLVGAIKISNKNEDEMKRNDTKAESIIRAHVRKIIRENLSVSEARVNTPKEYEKVGPEGEKLSKIAKQIGMSTAGVRRAAGVAKSAMEDSWLYATTPAEMNMFKQAGQEFLNNLEAEALNQMKTGSDKLLIDPMDIRRLLSIFEVKTAVKQYVSDLSDPRSYDSPEDALSPEEINDLRSNLSSVLTLPGFIYEFLVDFLRREDNWELLDSMRTFSQSAPYQAVYKKLEKKYAKTDREALKKDVKSRLGALGAARQD